jgi:hypothetical protein
MDKGPENALYNLKDAAKALLNWDRIGKVRLTPARREQFKELMELTPSKLEKETQQ